METRLIQAEDAIKNAVEYLHELVAARETIAKQAARISEMTAVLRQYRDFHKKGRRPCIESATCSTCQEAEPFLAPDQPKGEN